MERSSCKAEGLAGNRAQNVLFNFGKRIFGYGRHFLFDVWKMAVFLPGSGEKMAVSSAAGRAVWADFSALAAVEHSGSGGAASGRFFCPDRSCGGAIAPLGNNKERAKLV